MVWTTVLFGKYSGNSLPQILMLDADWFFYMLPKLYGRLGEEAQDLARKATAIRIPGPDADKKVVEYWCEKGYPPGSGGFGFVNPNSPCFHGSIRRPYLDLSFVCRAKSYDKRGCRNLIRDFRSRYFGPNTRLTKDRIEEFFGNEDNFVKRRFQAKVA